MNAELEGLLKADEEARVRIDSAQVEADAAVRKAEKDCADQCSSRLEQLRAELGDEVRSPRGARGRDAES